MEIIPQAPGWGTTIGQSLQEGLKNIANYKMQQLMERQQYKQQQERGSEIWRNLGFPDQQAKALGSLPPQQQQMAIRHLSPTINTNLQQLSQQPGQASNLQQSLQQLQPQQQVQQQVGQQLGQQRQLEQVPVRIQKKMQEPQANIPVQAPEQLTPQQPKAEKMLAGVEKQAEVAPKQTQVEPTKIEKAPETRKQKLEAQEQENLVKAQTPLAENPQKQLKTQEKEVKKLIKSPELKAQPTPKVKKAFAKEIKAQEKAIKQEKYSVSKKKETKADQNKIEKENTKFREELEDYAVLYPDQTRRVKEQLDLVNSGNMSYPVWHSFLDTLENGIHGVVNLGGINLHSLESKETQKFDKLRAENIAGAKATIGARMAVEEFKAYMAQFASSSHSDEAKVELLNNQLLRLEAQKIRYNNMRKIIEENNGKEPKYLKQLIEQRSAKDLLDLNERYKQGEFGQKYTAPKGILESGPVEDIKNLVGTARSIIGL